MTHDEVIQKVRQLYRLAQGNTTEGEAHAAIRAAELLIQKHRLSEAQIHGATPDVIRDGIVAPETRAIWRRLLLKVLSRHYGCALVRMGRGLGFRAFGTASDVAILALQFDRLVDQIERMTVRNASGKGRSYADGYRKGCVATVAALLRDSRPEPAHGTSTALATLDQRYERSEAARNAACPGLILRKVPRVQADAAAYEHGQRDGRHLHFGESLGGSPRGLLGGKESP